MRFRLFPVACGTLFFLAVVSLLLLPLEGKTQQERWKLIAYDDEAKYSINMDHLDRQDESIQFWLKTERNSGETTSNQYVLFCRTFEFKQERSMSFQEGEYSRKDFLVSERMFLEELPVMIKGFELFCGERVTAYYDNGMLRERGWVYKPPGGGPEVKNGRWTYWHDNGSKSEELFFKEGRKEGDWTSWDRFGKKWKETHYKDDLLQGTWTTWYPNGQKSVERNYDKGVLDGRTVKWNKRGKVVEEIWHEQGMMVRQVIHEKKR